MTLGKPGGARPAYLLAAERRPRRAQRRHLRRRRSHGDAQRAHPEVRPRTASCIKVIGRKGTGPGEFDQPHALAMDSRGRLFVGDRGNNRIQILDQEASCWTSWTQFSRPSGIYIDRNDTHLRRGFGVGLGRQRRASRTEKRGIRIGSVKDGAVDRVHPRSLKWRPAPAPPKAWRWIARGTSTVRRWGRRGLSNRGREKIKS